MLEKVFHLVSFIGAVQGVLLATIFLTKKGNHPATKALAAYTFIFSIGLLEPYLEKLSSKTRYFSPAPIQSRGQDHR